MKLRTKIFLPIAIVLLLLGTVGYLLVGKQLNRLKQHMQMNMLQAKQAEVNVDIDLLSQQLVSRAAVFTKLPPVLEALRLANSGDIEDETDPQTQAARELLRRSLKHHLAGHADLHAGNSLKLHFYLGNGRSLARLWRYRQLKRDGQWIDVTDSVIHFRAMLRAIAKQTTPLRGIELGKAGFVVRGMVPIDEGDKRLGLVEVLMPLNPLLDSAVKNARAQFSLWMPVEYLDITTRLRDAQRYPILAERYVQVHTTHMDNTAPSLALLQQGIQRATLQQQGDMALGAFPIRDFSNKPIGVLVYEFDVSTAEQMKQQVNLVVLAVMVMMLMLIGLVTYLMVARKVAKPLLRVNQDLATLAQGQLSDQNLHYAGRDEIAEIVTATNQLKASIQRTIDQANAIAQGNYTTEVKLLSQQDQLGQALLNMQNTLRGVAQQANAIAEGNYSNEYQLLSEQDELGQALLEMTRTLREMDVQSRRQNWIKTGQTQLNDQISGEGDLVKLAEKIIQFIVPYLHAQMGAIYLAEYTEQQQVDKLKLLASYAYSFRKRLANEFKLGEGVVGQAALEQKLIMLTDAHYNYADLADSSGNIPSYVLVIPFSYEAQLKGVLEFASVEAFTDTQLEFLRQIVPNLGIVVNTAESRTQMQQLLTQLQQQ